MNAGALIETYVVAILKIKMATMPAILKLR